MIIRSKFEKNNTRKPVPSAAIVNLPHISSASSTSTHSYDFVTGVLLLPRGLFWYNIRHIKTLTTSTHKNWRWGRVALWYKLEDRYFSFNQSPVSITLSSRQIRNSKFYVKTTLGKLKSLACPWRFAIFYIVLFDSSLTQLIEGSFRNNKGWWQAFPRALCFLLTHAA